MELVSLSPEEFDAVYTRPLCCYATGAFAQLNAAKAREVECVSAVDASGRHRCGLIAGLTDEGWRAPFSAPFAAVSFNSIQKLETLADFARLLAERFGGEGLTITLPPSVYDPVMQPRVTGALLTVGRMLYADYNYHYELAHYPGYVACLEPNMRNHYNRSVRAGFTFAACTLARAYEVIARNRQQRGFPLRMTLDALVETSRLVAIDSFVLSKDGCDVAAAIIYRLNESVAQVIYWGHVEGWNESRPMAMLARCVMEHYYAAGYETVDIGPSSSEGEPNLGLCAFKEALGCTLTFKPTLTLRRR